jgi:arylsulfatase A-like enzyme
MHRPNVVFIISDQRRWDFMGSEGNGVTHKGFCWGDVSGRL